MQTIVVDKPKTDWAVVPAPGDTPGVVGISVTRRDAEAKARGKTCYPADIQRPGMLFGKMVRSPYARARVLDIDGAEARALPGVVAVLTSADIPGQNRVGPRQLKDQLVLVERTVNFAGEAVAVVAAETPDVASEAARLVRVKYLPLAPVNDPEFALSPEAPEVHDGGNLCHALRIQRGDFAAALQNADLVVSNTYRTQMVDHGYLEPDAALAELQGDLILVWVASNNAHSDRVEIARVLGFDVSKVRVISSAVGGSFGGKIDLPTCCLTALIAAKTGRPVSIVLDREEVTQTTLKRHPYRVCYSHAVSADGLLLGLKVDLLADAGAYANVSPSVVSRGLVHATGPYRVPIVDLHARAAYTNNPVTAGMRGYGVPQVAFAVERQMDIIAHKLGIDPIELRIRNALRSGDATATGQVLQDVRLTELLEKARAKAAEVDRAVDEEPHVKRAWGTAAFFYGCGRTGVADSSRALARLERNGTVRVFVGPSDLGQGSDTALAQIAADELGLPFDLVELTSADTEVCPEGGPTAATRVTYVVGNAVKRAAAALRSRLLETAGRWEGRAVDTLRGDSDYLAGLLRFSEQQGVPFESEGVFAAPTAPLDEWGQGSPYGAYTFGVQMSHVAVNTWTGKVDVLRTVSCYDVGTVVNPRLLEGQLEGGTVMSVGYALTEEVVLKDGVVMNPNFDAYLMPTAADSPTMTVMAIDGFDATGPFGAKGVGEPATVPGAASIANAISAATGIEFLELPITPEKVVWAVQS